MRVLLLAYRRKQTHSGCAGSPQPVVDPFVLLCLSLISHTQQSADEYVYLASGNVVPVWSSQLGECSLLCGEGTSM
jgi:hypothetical protein